MLIRNDKSVETLRANTNSSEQVWYFDKYKVRNPREVIE